MGAKGGELMEPESYGKESLVRIDDPKALDVPIRDWR